MTKTEIEALDLLTADGWKVYRNGWPDFFCVRKINGKFETKAVEVKSGYSGLTKQQRKMRWALRRAGVTTQLMRLGKIIVINWNDSDLEVLNFLRQRLQCSDAEIMSMALRALAKKYGVLAA